MEDLPANRIFIRSKGCRINVDVTPPDMPATRCSYLRNEKTFSFFGLPVWFLIVAIVLSPCWWWWSNVCMVMVLSSEAKLPYQRPPEYSLVTRRRPMIIYSGIAFPWIWLTIIIRLLEVEVENVIDSHCGAVFSQKTHQNSIKLENDWKWIYHYSCVFLLRGQIWLWQRHPLRSALT